MEHAVGETGSQANQSRRPAASILSLKTRRYRHPKVACPSPADVAAFKTSAGVCSIVRSRPSGRPTTRSVRDNRCAATRFPCSNPELFSLVLPITADRPRANTVTPRLNVHRSGGLLHRCFFCAQQYCRHVHWPVRPVLSCSSLSVTVGTVLVDHGFLQQDAAYFRASKFPPLP